MPSAAPGALRLFSFCILLLTLVGECRLGKVGAVDSSSDFCKPSDWKWDLDAMNVLCIEEVRKESDAKVLSSLITGSIRRGLWSCAAETLRAAAAAGSSAWDIFSIENRLLNTELSQLKRVADDCKPAVVHTISPAFEWAESPDTVYLNVKFSHRLDAPATLDITPGVTILPNQVKIEGRKGTKTFRLELNMYREIVPENSNWSMGSIGRVTITLFKTHKAIWTRLLLEDIVAPQNMRKWWSRANEFNEENLIFLKDEVKRLNASLPAHTVDNMNETDKLVALLSDMKKTEKYETCSATSCKDE